MTAQLFIVQSTITGTYVTSHGTEIWARDVARIMNGFHGDDGRYVVVPWQGK